MPFNPRNKNKKATKKFNKSNQINKTKQRITITDPGQTAAMRKVVASLQTVK